MKTNIMLKNLKNIFSKRNYRIKEYYTIDTKNKHYNQIRYIRNIKEEESFSFNPFRIKSNDYVDCSLEFALVTETTEVIVKKLNLVDLKTYDTSHSIEGVVIRFNLKKDTVVANLLDNTKSKDFIDLLLSDFKSCKSYKQKIDLAYFSLVCVAVLSAVFGIQSSVSSVLQGVESAKEEQRLKEESDKAYYSLVELINNSEVYTFEQIEDISDNLLLSIQDGRQKELIDKSIDSLRVNKFVQTKLKDFLTVSTPISEALTKTIIVKYHNKQLTENNRVLLDSLVNNYVDNSIIYVNNDTDAFELKEINNLISIDTVLQTNMYAINKQLDIVKTNNFNKSIQANLDNFSDVKYTTSAEGLAIYINTLKEYRKNKNRFKAKYTINQMESFIKQSAVNVFLSSSPEATKYFKTKITGSKLRVSFTLLLNTKEDKELVINAISNWRNFFKECGFSSISLEYTYRYQDYITTW